MAATLISTNPTFSILKKQEKELLFSLSGEIKLLRGPTGAITAILNALKEHTRKDDLLLELAQQYPEDLTEEALTHMMRSGIILETPVQKAGTNTNEVLARQVAEPQKKTAPRIGCLGSGPFAQTLAAQIGNDGFNGLFMLSWQNDAPKHQAAFSEATLAAWTEFFEERLARERLSALAVCPEEMNYLQLCAFNRACLNLGLPWVLGYFSGNAVNLGPTTIPFKTPCLECLLEHRLRALNPKLGIGWEQLWQCTENFSVPPGADWQSALDWAAWLLSAELSRLTTGQEAPLYMKRQLKISQAATPQNDEIAFEPITTCPACQGMNCGYIKIEAAKEPANLKRVEIPLREGAVQHRDNGLRALNGEEARTLLDRALARLKTNVKIKLCQGGILDGIIPSFRSHTSTVYSPDLPFNVYARHHWGKGMNEKQAYLSAGFELMERICAEYTQKVEMVRCSYKEVKDCAIDLETRVGKQYYLRNIDDIHTDIPVDWVWGWSLLNKKPLLVPASMVFLSKAVFQGKFTPASSTGLAAGTTMEDACLQGLLEAVEHDARYIWQANPVILPRITDFPEEIQKISGQLREAGCELIVRNYTTDLGVYVFRAWIKQPGNPVVYAASGLGASLKPQIALHRAITEAKQAWPSDKSTASLYFASKNNTDLFDSNTSTLFTHYQDTVTELHNGGPSVKYDSLPDLSSGNITEDIRNIMHRITSNVPGADIIAVNLTREEFGVPVVRVIASGLQNHSQPLQNFPGERLFELPVKLGYSNKRLSFKEIFNDSHQQ